jgi:hypothetical protein
MGWGPTVQAGGGGAAVVVIPGGTTTGGVTLGFGVVDISRAVLRVTDMAEVLDAANDELGVADTVTVLGISIQLHRLLKKGWTWDEALDYFQACPVGLLRE